MEVEGKFSISFHRQSRSAGRNSEPCPAQHLISVLDTGARAASGRAKISTDECPSTDVPAASFLCTGKTDVLSTQSDLPA